MKWEKIKAEKLSRIKAGGGKNCWAVGSGCDCTHNIDLGNGLFGEWIDDLDSTPPPSG